jgi:hypothetical protein
MNDSIDHSLKLTSSFYRRWRVLPDSSCFSGRAIFCVDILKGKYFTQKMNSLTEMVITTKMSDQFKEDFTFVCNEAKKILVMNQFVLISMKRLYNFWRLKHLRIMNENDPITLSLPIKPVYVITSSKYKFVYEAETIALDIHKRLLHHDGQIPDPLQPRNILTNELMTFQQTISILKQCKDYGYSHWTLEAFKKSGYSIRNFYRTQRGLLRYNAIVKIINTPGDCDGIDTLTDFIHTQFDYHNIHYSPILFVWALRNIPTDPIILEWKRLCKQWYSSLIFDTTLAIIQDKTKSLCKQWHELHNKMIEMKKIKL